MSAYPDAPSSLAALLELAKDRRVSEGKQAKTHFSGLPAVGLAERDVVRRKAGT
jgi:hypothetical protein